MISRHQQRRLTYRELDEWSNVVAEGLRERGVKKGARVGVMREFPILGLEGFDLGCADGLGNGSGE